MLDFEEATRVVPEEGGFTAALSSSWAAFGPNGGYLATIALRSVGQRSTFRRPASVDCTFLSRGSYDKVTLDVLSLSKGRRAECFRVSMSQGKKALLEAHIWMTEEAAGLVHDVTTMPEIPPPDALPSMDSFPPKLRRGGESRFTLFENIEERSATWGAAKPSGPGAPVLRSWFRFRPNEHFEDPLVDAGRSLVLLDLLMVPAAIRAYEDTIVIAPTLSLSVQFHRPAPPGWLLCDHRAPVAEAGLIYGEASSWGNGKIVASAHSQSACLGPPMSRA